MGSAYVELPILRVATLTDAAKDVNRTKALAYVPLPAHVRGKNATAAVAKFYLYGYQYSASLSISCKTNSNPANDWTDSTAYNVLDGYTLADLSNAQSVNTTLQQYSWNVLGDATKGVKYAMAPAQSHTFVTLVLTGPVATATQKIAGLSVGVDDDDEEGSLKLFEYAGRTGGNPANVGYLAVTYDVPDVAPDAPTSPTVNGSATNPYAATAGFPTFGWATPTNTGVSYYEVQVDGGSWINVGNVTSYRYTGNFDPTVSHTWAVRAVNAYGTSAALAGNAFTVPETWTETAYATFTAALKTAPFLISKALTRAVLTVPGAGVDVTAASFNVRQYNWYSGSGTIPTAARIGTAAWNTSPMTPQQVDAVDFGTASDTINIGTGSNILRTWSLLSQVQAIFAAATGSTVDVSPILDLRGADADVVPTLYQTVDSLIYFGSDGAYGGYGMVMLYSSAEGNGANRPYVSIAYAYTGTTEPPATTRARPGFFGCGASGF
jgi:hypothetical protein